MADLPPDVDPIMAEAAEVLFKYDARMSVLFSQEQLLRELIDAVTPRIEADLLERVAAIYEAEAGKATVVVGGHVYVRHHTDADVAERMRYWRQNLTELAAMRQDGGSDV